MSIQLGLYFASLSLLTFGGLSPLIPEVQRYIVDTKGWLTPMDFMQLFAVAQAAPGPNVLIASLIGYRVAGFTGSLIALAALCLPAAALTWVVSGLWERLRNSPWRPLIQRALLPPLVGLIFAGGYVIATPHVGGLTLQAIEHQAFETVAQVAEIVQGRAPKGAVNPQHATRLAKMSSRSEA